MVCKNCSSAQLLDNSGSLKCLKCDKITLLNKPKALYAVKKQFDWVNGGLTQVLNRFDKRRLIAWILGEREKIASLFFTDKPQIPLDDFLSMTALVKRVMQIYDVEGKDEANEKNTPELIGCFSGFIRIAERHNLIKEDFAYYSAKENIDPEKVDYKTLMSNYKLYFSEDWFSIMETFKENQLMTKDEAEEFYKKFEDEFKKVKDSHSKPKEVSTEERINRLYPTMLSFFSGLNKNIIYKNTFNFEYLKNNGISPEDILAIVREFPLKYGIINGIHPREFKKYLKKKFKGQDPQKIYDSLVFSHENQSVFPLFVRLDHYVLVSICFSKLITLFYYPFYYKELFVKETERLSLKFEKKGAPEKFRESGFKVKNDIRDKKDASLQIDTVAWKGGKLYVVETKAWDIKPFFEHRRVHNYMTRDLKGVVDGKKYTMKEGKLTERDIPSLLIKLKFVSDNIKDICHEFANIKKIEGLIVTKSYPPIKEYKCIKIIAFNKIPNL